MIWLTGIGFVLVCLLLMEILLAIKNIRRFR